MILNDGTEEDIDNYLWYFFHANPPSLWAYASGKAAFCYGAVDPYLLGKLLSLKKREDNIAAVRTFNKCRDAFILPMFYFKDLQAEDLFFFLKRSNVPCVIQMC